MKKKIYSGNRFDKKPTFIENKVAENKAQKKQKKAKKIATFILGFFGLLIIISSVLSVFMFTDKYIVNADTITSSWQYNSENLFVPIDYGSTRYNESSDGEEDGYFIGIDFKLRNQMYLSDTYIMYALPKIGYDSFLYSANFLQTNPNNYDFTTNNNAIQNPVGATDYILSYVSARSYSKVYELGTLKQTQSNGANCRLYCSFQQFNANNEGSDTPLSDVVSVFYEVYLHNSNKTNDYRLHFRYTDSNGRYIDIYYYWDTAYSYFFSPELKSRTYYLTAALSDNVAYQNGYTSGYSTGYSEGSSSGYTRGYNIGYNNGYNVGIVDQNAGDYTFLSLMTAIIDAPVTVIKKSLNFEILGFNLQGFLFGLLTVALIFAIVRLFMKGSE